MQSYEKLRLYRPVVTNKLTQVFGVSKACVFNDGRVVSKNRQGNCPHGSRDLYRSLGMAGHNGLDFATHRGESIFKCGTFDGWMKTEVGRDGGIGVDVISNRQLFFPGKPPAAIADKVQLWSQHGEEGFISFVKERHWHCLSAVGHDYKQVKLGQVIALADSTGASSGDHDHFGMKFCDDRGVRLDRTPDWTGAFDPLPFMNVTYDARTAAEMLFKDAPVLSPQERREISGKLSTMRQLVLKLLELRRHV